MSAALHLDHSHVEQTRSVTEYATKGVRRRTRVNLRLVAPLRVRKASRGLFVIVLASILGIGLFGLLLIHTTLAQGAFTVSELRSTHAQLSRAEAALTESVAALTVPTVLEAKARELGMVLSPTPAFIQIHSGKILGKARPAPGARLVTPTDATAGAQGIAGEWSDPTLIESQVVTEDLALDAIAAG